VTVKLNFQIREGTAMAKAQDSKKNVKKKPQKTTKEKRLEKLEKKKNKNY